MTRRTAAFALVVLVAAGGLIVASLSGAWPRAGGDGGAESPGAAATSPGLSEIATPVAAPPRAPTPEAGARVVRIRSHLPPISTEAELEAYIGRQHRLLADIAAETPAVTALARITFTRPIGEDELHRLVPDECVLGNLSWHGPRDLNGGGGAQFVLPLETTEEWLRRSGVLGPDESIEGIIDIEVRCPVAALLDVREADDVLVVDVGDLRALLAVEPGVLVDFDVPDSLYSEHSRLAASAD